MYSFLIRRAGLLVLLVAATLTACKKAPEADPDLANRLAGSYTLSQVTVNGQSVPAADAQLRGGVTVTRETATAVTLEFNVTYRVDNSEVLVGEIGDVALTDTGGGNVELRAQGERVGRGSRSELVIEAEDDNGEAFSMTFKRN
jgi:hypothetical protein